MPSTTSGDASLASSPASGPTCSGPPPIRSGVRATPQSCSDRSVMPLGPDDPGARMAAVRDLVARQRSEPALASTDAIAGVLNRLPTTMTTQLFGSMLKGVDFITSNVPGTPVPVYVAGAQIEANFPFGPLSGAATNVVLLSYIDELHIGVNTDPAAIPDAEVFVGCLEEGFDEVRKAG